MYKISSSDRFISIFYSIKSINKNGLLRYDATLMASLNETLYTSSMYRMKPCNNRTLVDTCPFTYHTCFSS